MTAGPPPAEYPGGKAKAEKRGLPEKEEAEKGNPDPLEDGMRFTNPSENH
jgi:hypothetical protein